MNEKLTQLYDYFLPALVHVGIRYFLVAGIAFILFYVIFKKVLENRKIQENFPKLNDYGRDIFYSVITIFIFTMVALLTLVTFADYTLIYDDINAKPTWYYWGSLLLMFALHDFYFYWIHRMMHMPKLYRHFHKVHHTSTNPSPWTAYSFHPLEAILEAAIIPLIAITIPAHRSAIIIFFVFQIVYNVYGHLGFELWARNFHKTWIGRFVNTSVAHNMHHKKFHGNFGLYTLIWDRVFGTLRKDYDRDFENATTKKVQGEIAN